MCRCAVILILTAVGLVAEVRTLNLRQAVELALEQNPDLALTRLDEKKAEQAVRLAKDPFAPKVVAGSGLAYSSGLPMSIEGATPSIVQARAIADVFNRPQSYRVAAAQENRRAATIDAAAKQQEVAFRTAELFLEAEKAAKLEQLARQQAGGLARILATINARVAEGRELPIESRRAALNLARAQYRVQVLESNRAYAERLLAEVLGLNPNDRVQAAPEERTPPALPPSEDAAIQSALQSSRELRSLESRLLAKGFDIRAERAERWPKLDLVAQYALLGRFNNYEDFFRKFQRHNGQLGVSIQIPIWTGPRVAAAVAQAEAEAAQLRLQIRSARSRITAETARWYQEVKQAESARDLARLDLEVAREQVSILLAQAEEGRAGLRQLEEARSAETDKWLAFYDAAVALEKARLSLLKQTGTLLAALH
jgi:outer membrane protein